MNSGAVVSTTLMVCVAELLLPASSDAVNVRSQCSCLRRRRVVMLTPR